jgi:acyl-CoA synthetase (AMP-forming)/AMP-acid ligase II
MSVAVQRNLAELLITRARQSPDLCFGAAGSEMKLADAVALASQLAQAASAEGLGRGSCAMLIGTTSTEYLVAWAAMQLAGVEVALVNPTYPATLLSDMAADLRPDLVLWVGVPCAPQIAPQLEHFDLSEINRGRIVIAGQEIAMPHAAADLPGLEAEPGDIASYMHTSGTSGAPKFCAQSHEYMLRLGRFIADSMSLTRGDVVYAPLPMFHINPLGYGVVASLTAGASVLAAERFSASRFWPDVIENGVTAAVLHAPPVAILQKATTPADAAGHNLRIVFAGYPEFLEQFDIPQGVTAYGSTEAAGLSHSWMCRPGDRDAPPEGPTRYAGRARYDLEWRLSDEGEILLRDRCGRALFSGYRRAGMVHPALDEDGWFHTGDLGRLDEWGSLVFVERLSESIRARGEYVPIDFVEQHLQAVAGLGDFAIWRRPAALSDHEVVLYVAGERLAATMPLDAISAAVADLPVFMRPVAVIHIDALPRDSGVGKVQRRRLEDAPVRSTWTL